MGKIYTGRFLSRKQVEYVVNIYREGVDVKTPGDLVFGEVPAEIEWSEVDKLEPVQGSALTLTLLSTSDRQYTDLYAVQTGEVWVELLRKGELYWRGTLDTEFYEEPYSYPKDYEVEFTFSDFGTLERLKWSDRGVRTLEWILRTCLEAIYLDYDTTVRRVSTALPMGYVDTDILTACTVNGENWFDEDDEPMTMREVLDAVLQPFALRMVQKGGRVELFDLNALYAEGETKRVKWMSDDAELGADVVYNDVTVTFSPYADTTLIDGTLEHDDTLQATKGGSTYYLSTDTEDKVEGFTIVTGDPDEKDDPPFKLSNGAKLFRIDPIYSGNDEAGVFMMRRGEALTSAGVDQTMVGTQRWLSKSDTELPNVGSVKEIISFDPVHINYCKSDRFRLKVELSVCIDARYNPFEGSDKTNEEGNYNRLQNWVNFGYLPVKLELLDEEGNAVQHYENRGVLVSDGYTAACGWRSGAASWSDFWLCWYDRSDRKTKSGFDGWATNKQIIGYYRKDLPRRFEKMGDGEFIAPPSADGWLRLTIGDGIYAFDYGREVKNVKTAQINRWFLLRDPKVSIVDKYGNEIDTDDQEDKAWLNRAAQEGLDIDTTVGTLEDAYQSGSARGVVHYKTGAPLTEFQRAGVTDRLERLLIGTAYSQYAERKTTLSGTAELLPELLPLTEASTPGRFTLLSEVQHLQDDLSEITMAEFAADNYEGIDYE